MHQRTLNSQEVISEGNYNFRDESQVTDNGLRVLNSNHEIESQDEVVLDFQNKHKPKFLQTSDQRISANAQPPPLLIKNERDLTPINRQNKHFKMPQSDLQDPSPRAAPKERSPGIKGRIDRMKNEI